MYIMLKHESGPVVIRAPSGDTDIPIILLVQFPDLEQQIFLDNGHGNNRKIFNGYEYVSAFFRKGKKSSVEPYAEISKVCECVCLIGD